MSILVGEENIFARPHKYEIIGRDKYKVDGGQIQSQGARGKSVTVTGTNLISKGQLVLTALQVSTATVRRLLIPVRMGMRMIHVRIIYVRMIKVKMIHVRMIKEKIIHVRRGIL